MFNPVYLEYVGDFDHWHAGPLFGSLGVSDKAVKFVACNAVEYLSAFIRCKVIGTTFLRIGACHIEIDLQFDAKEILWRNVNHSILHQATHLLEVYLVA